MPIYEYTCDTCKTTKELLQNFNSPAPTCCKSKMKKLISNSTFHLKGSGWYVTDYKNNKSVDRGNAKGKRL